MVIRKYRQAADEGPLMQMIAEEKGWDYANAEYADRYRKALISSLTYVAYHDDVLCGYSRSIDDGGLYIYVCDLLVRPAFRGQGTGIRLMECLLDDYPGVEVYVMSDEDGYYNKIGYSRKGSLFLVERRH